MIAVRAPGKSRNYNVIDETTGEIVETISRRQYDKRFGVLAKQGFTSYEAREKALSYRVEGPFKLAKSIHHVYEFKPPQNLNKAIEKIIESSPQFGNKMMLAVEVEIYGVGKPYKRWLGTTVFKKASFSIKDMITELLDTIANDYNIEYAILQYSLTVIDKATLE